MTTTRAAGAEPQLPTGTVTFLFTDVEGSTSSWDREPARMDEGLVIHDGIVRSAVAHHGGYVFSTAGDSFAAAFPVAADAVRAAIEIQLELRATSWPGGLTLPVRIGLHTGHAVERGGDYFGPVVNRAARVMDAGHGGQILCSAVTTDLARPELDATVGFQPLGEVRLRDLLQPERLLQVTHASLPAQFPPPRALDQNRHNLPVQRTRLIGRDRDVAHIAELVRDHRLVTLTGVGGCGKSRLALAVAAELSTHFPDGAYFVELAPVADEERLASVVAEVVGLRVDAPAGGTSRGAAIAAFIARRDMLIVLDNCEHLLDAVAEFVDELLAAGSSARVLATSREALGVEGERGHRVSSLSAGGERGDRAAIELFVERAGESTGGRAIAGADDAVVADICRHLDGLPLAIELAAAQLIMMSPPELLAHLDRRFELLVGGRRRQRQRQQTLQTVMDWSWDLLDAHEQRLLAALSVFSGGWTLEAAEGVCHDVVNGTVAPVLRALVAKSLVEPFAAGSVTRHRLLETVRLYAQQRLVDLDLAEALRSAHCRWFVDSIESVPLDERLFSFASMERLHADFDNLAAAVDWAIDRDPNAAARIVAAEGTLALAGVGPMEVLRWTHGLLERQLDDRVRARLLVAGALAAVLGGEHANIVGWAAEAASLARGHDDITLALALVWQAAPRMVPQPDLARALMDDARAAADRSGAPLCQGFVECWSITEAMCAPDLTPSLVSPEDAARFGGRDTWGWGGAVQVGAIVLAEHGRPADAMTLLEQVGWFSGVTLPRPGYEVMVTALTGRPDTARQLAAAFIVEVDRTSDINWHAELVLALAICSIREDDNATALAYLECIKRAQMFQPFWYELRRRYAARARTGLDEETIAEAVRLGRTLTVESILDTELRDAHSGTLPA
jgi:predicted ATPase/class 3 adenylate cyclase